MLNAKHFITDFTVNRAGNRRNNAVCKGTGKRDAAGITDCINRFTDRKAVRVAEFSGFKPCGGDTQNADVGSRIIPDHGCVILGFVVKLHLNCAAVADDVRAGHNIGIFAGGIFPDNHAGAFARKRGVAEAVAGIHQNTDGAFFDFFINTLGGQFAVCAGAGRCRRLCDIDRSGVAARCRFLDVVPFDKRHGKPDDRKNQASGNRTEENAKSVLFVLGILFNLLFRLLRCAVIHIIGICTVIAVLLGVRRLLWRCTRRIAGAVRIAVILLDVRLLNR